MTDSEKKQKGWSTDEKKKRVEWKFSHNTNRFKEKGSNNHWGGRLCLDLNVNKAAGYVTGAGLRLFEPLRKRQPFFLSLAETQTITVKRNFEGIDVLPIPGKGHYPKNTIAMMKCAHCCSAVPQPWDEHAAFTFPRVPESWSLNVGDIFLKLMQFELKSFFFLFFLRNFADNS